MSSNFFKGFVLLGFLCLWVTPTEEKLSIVQSPKPAKLNEPVSLILEGVNTTGIHYFNWFKARVPDSDRLVIGYLKGRNPLFENGTFREGTVAEENGTLTFSNFSRSQVDFYSVQVQGSILETDTIVLIGSSPSLISSSFLLLATALFSSLRLL